MKLTLNTDFYEYTMGQAAFKEGRHEDTVYFDVFFRRNPGNLGYSVMGGLHDVIKFINNFKFEKDDIDYLKSLNKFSDDYLEYLKDMKFTGDIWAVPDGNFIFPNEPIITVKAPYLEAQFIETQILQFINHRSLISTSTRRIVNASGNRPVMEFGTRRAQGIDAGLAGARVAYIAGAAGTACTLAGKEYGIPVLGTMAHSFVQFHDNEYEAFKAYAKAFPDECTLLVDTYDTLKSGIPNAIKVNNEVLKPMGKKLAGIRIDSGDLAYLSKKARQMLNLAGLTSTKICTSNSLDEKIITSLLQQGAPIDSFGVGENLITSKEFPVFGGVYKLCAVEKENKILPKIKVSEDNIKITNPDFKTIYRFYDKETGAMLADLIATYDEPLPKDMYLLEHETDMLKKKLLTNFEAVQLRKKIFEKGELIYNEPTIKETRKICENQNKCLYEEHKRRENPEPYIVDISAKLRKLKYDMIKMIHSSPEVELLQNQTNLYKGEGK